MALRECERDLHRHERAYRHRDMSVVDTYLKVGDVGSQLEERLARVEKMVEDIFQVIVENRPRPSSDGRRGQGATKKKRYEGGAALFGDDGDDDY